MSEFLQKHLDPWQSSAFGLRHVVIVRETKYKLHEKMHFHLSIPVCDVFKHFPSVYPCLWCFQTFPSVYPCLWCFQTFSICLSLFVMFSNVRFYIHWLSFSCGFLLYNIYTRYIIIILEKSRLSVLSFDCSYSGLQKISEFKTAKFHMAKLDL